MPGAAENTIAIEVVVGAAVLEDGRIARLHDPPGGELGEELPVDADRARARRGLWRAEIVPVQTRDVDELVVDGDCLTLKVDVAPAQAERFADTHACMIKEQDRGVEHRSGRICLQQCVEALRRYDRPLDDLLGRLGRYADVLSRIAADESSRIDSVLQAGLQDGECGLCRRVGQVIHLHEVGCPLVNHERRQILQSNVAKMRRDVVPHHRVIEVYRRVADARRADGMYPLVKEIGQQRLSGRDADAAVLPSTVCLYAGIEGIILRRKAAFLDDLSLAVDVASLEAVGPRLAALASPYSCHNKKPPFIDALSVVCGIIKP